MLPRLTAGTTAGIAAAGRDESPVTHASAEIFRLTPLARLWLDVDIRQADSIPIGAFP
jgi:hypothetical protein